MEVIIKVAERCILGCRYCYFFKGLDVSHKDHPPYVSKSTINKIYAFLKQGIDELNIKKLVVSLHGGETLLVGKENFSYLCDTLIEGFNDIVLQFHLQTNGLLIDKEWIDLFIKYNVNIGVSIDGPKEIHNQNRIYPNGKGTYDNLVKKIYLLQENNIPRLGTLSVINSSSDGKKIYRHFVDDLKIYNFDLLLSDYTHDRKPNNSLLNYTKVLVDVFYELIKDDDLKINIRTLRSFLGQLIGEERLIYGIGAVNQENEESLFPIITIRSNGDLEPTDELMSTDPETVTKTNCNIFNTSLKDFLKHPIFEELRLAQTVLPLECQKCCWGKVCGGGGLVNRFSKENRFNNPSVYCEGLKDLFSHLTSYLLNSGVSLSKIESALFS